MSKSITQRARTAHKSRQCLLLHARAAEASLYTLEGRDMQQRHETRRTEAPMPRHPHPSDTNLQASQHAMLYLANK